MNIPLIEKYRPQFFADIVGVADIEKIQQLIKTPKDMPNLLFYGPQGSGKTTLAKVILKSIEPVDFIRINGSDTTGVDTIRETVYNFMTSKSRYDDKPKIVWIEEFDYMSANAYAALRSMIEQFIKNARFICTCNYIEKVPEPIRSRFANFEVKQTDYQEIEARLMYICNKEEIKFPSGTEYFIDLARKTKGDIRSCINIIQQMTINGELQVGNLKLIGLLTEEVFNLILRKEWTKIRYEIPKKSPDYNQLIVDIDEMFFNSPLETTKKIEINDILARGQYEMSMSFNKDLCFSAICARIMKVL